MPDQFEVGIERLLIVLNKINTSIQKTETYKDNNLITFGADEVTEIIGVGGGLAALDSRQTFIGSAVGAISISGLIDVIKELFGSSDAVGDADSDLHLDMVLYSDVLESLGSVIGSLDRGQGLVGSEIIAATEIIVNMIGARIKITADLTAESVVSDSPLKVDTQLAGASTGTATGAAAYMWA